MPTAIAILVGCLGFFLAVGGGLFRLGGGDPIVTGTWCAAISGALWYMSGVIPVVAPARIVVATVCNAFAAIFAAASASYLVGDASLPTVRRAFGLG